MWEPIETAPIWTPTKPAPNILVIGGVMESELGGKEPVNEAVKVSRYSEDGFSVVDTCYYSVYVTNPTHWMPLPEPPKGD